MSVEQVDLDIAPEVDEVERPEIAGWRRALAAGDVEGQIPFPVAGGLEADWMEHFWQSCFGEGELVFNGGPWPLPAAGEASRLAAGHRSHTCRRVDRTGGLRLSEFDTFLSLTVQMRCLMEWMSITVPLTGVEGGQKKTPAAEFNKRRHRTRTRHAYVRIKVEGNYDAE